MNVDLCLVNTGYCLDRFGNGALDILRNADNIAAVAYKDYRIDLDHVIDDLNLHALGERLDTDKLGKLCSCGI